MRVLLITPKADCTPQIAPDLGIGYIASALREHLYSVDFVDMGRDKISLAELSKMTGGNEYLFVGIKVFSTSVAAVNEIISAIKSSSSKTKIVIGGPHPTLVPREALLACPQADIGVIGEGEAAVVEIARRLEKGESFNDVESITFREGQEVRLNQKKSNIDIDSLHGLAWDLMEPALYSGYENLWLLCRGQRPAHISLTREGVGGKSVYRKIDDVADEIEKLKRLYGVDELLLADAVFSLDRAYMYKFCEMFIRREFKIPWASPYSSRHDLLDAPLLRAVQESGAYCISVSLESGSERVMNEVYNGSTVEQFKEKINLIKETTSLPVKVAFRVGNPTETLDDFKETIELARRMPINMAVFAPLCLMPGDDAVGYLKEHEPESLPNWGDQKLAKVVYTPKGVSYEDLEKWSQSAYRAFYLRPSAIFKLPSLFKGKGKMPLLAARLRKPNYL